MHPKGSWAASIGARSSTWPPSTEADCRNQLVERGIALRERLYMIGAQREPILILTGIK
jgi:hypothetical protein